MTTKINPSHLERKAYVYVRQSSPAQVHEHIESRERQYALEKRAIALGWNPTAVEIVDEDQGKSGTTAQGRQGFARLAHAVAHGEAGAIFAVEVSRLARSSQDWQRLLALCAVAHVVVVDENTVYDPGHHDDKLLLDLKGAMSEQELHWLSLRLAGGRLNKARRGESYVTPPTGYLWGGKSLEIDPDESVQKAVHLVFERFRIEPSARAVLRWALRTGFLMPTRQRGSDEIRWVPLGNLRFLDMLRNPAYAGVYVYGRHPTRTELVQGQIKKRRTRLDNPAQWPVGLKDAHPAYISWETYMSNQDKLRQNRSRLKDASRSAPRQGLALLAGLLICGKCGRRMSVRYDGRAHLWIYACWGDCVQGTRLCWSLAGPGVDRAIEQLFLETMVPSELELSLAVEREVESQAEAIQKAWRTRLEQVRYEARRAERRYKAVDPDNRVVARTLEREWEHRLQEQQEVEQQYAQARSQRHAELSEQDRQRIRQLAQELPQVWRAPTTSMADRKAMLRLVIEAVAVHPIDIPRRAIRVRVQWQSGAVSELEVARPRGGDRRKHTEEALHLLKELAAAGCADDEIAQQLNEEGIRTGTGLPWDDSLVRAARRKQGIERVAPDRPRMRPLPFRHPDGRYSVPGAMARCGVSAGTIYRWIEQGLIPATRSDFGTHRNVFWLDMEAAQVARRRRRGHRSSKHSAKG